MRKEDTERSLYLAIGGQTYNRLFVYPNVIELIGS